MHFNKQVSMCTELYYKIVNNTKIILSHKYYKYYHCYNTAIKSVKLKLLVFILENNLCW